MPLCSKVGENLTHLSLHCHHVSIFWYPMTSLWGLIYVCSSNVDPLFEYWFHYQLLDIKAEELENVFLCSDRVHLKCHNWVDFHQSLLMVMVAMKCFTFTWCGGQRVHVERGFDNYGYMHAFGEVIVPR